MSKRGKTGRVVKYQKEESTQSPAVVRSAEATKQPEAAVNNETEK